MKNKAIKDENVIYKFNFNNLIELYVLYLIFVN